jgi:hypothetical protein
MKNVYLLSKPIYIMLNNVRVLANAESITTESNQASEPNKTTLFNLIHQLKAGQFNEVAQKTMPDDPEFNNVYDAIKELAVIMERDSYELSILSRQIKVFLENVEDKDRPALRVS